VFIFLKKINTNHQRPKSRWVSKVVLTLNAKVTSNKQEKSWYLDICWSRYMTGDRQCFLSFEKKEGQPITSRIKGKCFIGKNNSVKFDNIQYVKGLKHILLNISVKPVTMTLKLFLNLTHVK